MAMDTKARAEFLDAAREHGWERHLLGPGVNRFSRAGDVIDVQFSDAGSDYPYRLHVAEVLFNGQPITTSDNQEYNARCALNTMQENVHVQRLNQVRRDSDDDWAVIPHEILDEGFHEEEFGVDATGCGVKVGAFDGGFTVWCTDFVANDWTEWFPTLSSAMARVALLIYCGERSWDRGFGCASGDSGAAAAFDLAAQEFMHDNTV